MPFYDDLDFLEKVQQLASNGHTVILNCAFEIIEDEEDTEDGLVEQQ